MRKTPEHGAKKVALTLTRTRHARYLEYARQRGVTLDSLLVEGVECLMSTYPLSDDPARGDEREDDKQ
ncbi:hypothetical protein [Paraburkholderia sp. EG304]|uniref:hypothetical protein n=1 Tax=Paraburkholderia sp. EG304 TaxID=3237015 RepID=UPI00397D50A1